MADSTRQTILLRPVARSPGCELALRSAHHPASSAVAIHRLALNPDLAALPDLLLPDGDDLLEPVDEVVTGLERLLAVRRGDGDEKRRLADLQAARAGRHRDVRDWPTGPRLPGDF